MKLIKTIGWFSLLVLVIQILFMAAQAQAGITCSDRQRVCRDDYGLNIDLTRRRYGEQAANWVRHQRSVQMDSSGPRRGKSSSWQSEQQYQRRHFGLKRQDGSKPLKRLKRLDNAVDQQQEVFTPIGGVRCVRSKQVCYHYNQPSAYFTRIYLGTVAADRLKQR